MKRTIMVLSTAVTTLALVCGVARADDYCTGNTHDPLCHPSPGLCAGWFASYWNGNYTDGWGSPAEVTTMPAMIFRPHGGVARRAELLRPASKHGSVPGWVNRCSGCSHDWPTIAPRIGTSKGRLRLRGT